MSIRRQFEEEKIKNIARQGSDQALRDLALDFMRETGKYNYTYNFTWMGVPLIQFPQDLLAIQEIIFETKPDLVIETGVAHGGGLVFYSSLLHLLGRDGRVLGIDIALRDHNRKAILEHPMASRIELLHGSSTASDVIEQVRARAQNAKQPLVILDSNHTHEHVLKELELYSPFVKPGGYLIVLDTTIEDQPEGFFGDKPWDKHDNPKTAVREFLKGCDRFVVDRTIEDKLLITVAREGFLRCVKPA